MRWIAVLCLLLPTMFLGCNEPLADRCDVDDDCPDGQVCSNDGDRSHKGYCEPAPEEEEEMTSSLWTPVQPLRVEVCHV